MRKLYSVLFVLLCLAARSFAQNVTVNPGAGSYATLAGAFTAINAGTHTGAITIDIVGSTTEPAGGAILNASGSGSASYTSILIQPSGGAARTITGAATAGLALIDLNGADNVTFNGLNTGGNSLTIANTTASATSGTSTIRFIGGATNNTITNCSIQGSSTMDVATNGATIFFSTDANTANGNDNNTISNNDIGPAGANLPTKAILGNGTATTTAIGNSGITITNNNIFDYFGAAVTSSGIAINGGCNTWSITNNRFYQTGARTWTTGAAHRAINLNSTTATSGVQGMTVTGNIIGYASNTQTGVYTLTGAGTGAKFAGIVHNGISASTASISIISNNTVAAVSMTGVTGSGTTTASPFTAILAQEGNITTNGNTIGSQSATGSLTFSTTTTSSTDVYGIHNFSSNAWTCNNNTVGGITATNLGASGTFLLIGIRAFTGAAATWSATGNTVGGTVANSIQLTATGTSSQVQGMLASLAPAQLTSNTIRNLTTNIGTGTTTTASVIGISATNTTPNHALAQNTIYSLNNTNATAASVVTGIQITGSTANLVQRNFIYDLNAASTSATAEVNGIRIGGGTTTYRNNMIAIGAGLTANSLIINGIMEAGGTNNFYHNSVYIGGGGIAAGTANSFALQSTVTSGTRNYRDNILFNARSNGGATGKHYAIRVGGTVVNPAGLTSNNNVLYATGSGGFTGLYNAIDQSTLANWQSATGNDANSYAGNPQYNDAANAIPDLHLHPTLATVAEGNGFDVGVTDDYDGQTRASLTPIDIGADAGNYNGIDLAPPGISYTPLPFSCSTGDRALNGVTITDVSGVPTTGPLQPRVYYRKNAGTWYSSQGTLASGTATNGTWNFTIIAADMGGVANSDVIQYYVIAQDIIGPNISSNPSGVVAASVNSVTTAPASPNSYFITNSLNGTYNVGAGQTYTTLTAAIAAYNTSCLTGPVVFQLMDAGYAEAGAMTISSNPNASAINTLTIRPASGVTASVSAAAASAAVLKIQGSYVIVDGSNNGSSSRDLTFTNTSTTTPYVIAVASSGSTAVTYVTVKNSILINGTNASAAALVASDGATLGNAGIFNNITLQNNSLQKAYIGINMNAAVSAGNGAGTLVENNSLDASGANAIRFVGIQLTGVDGAVVRGNTIANFESITSEPDKGILINTGTTNTVVERNTIQSLLYTGTSGYGAKGIAVSTGLANANISVRNNMISNITGDADGYGSFGATFAPAGIFVSGAGQGGVGIYFNTIYMTGNTLNFKADSYSFGIAVDDGAIATIKNNIIHNNLGRLGSTGVGAVGIGVEVAASQVAGANYNNFYIASNAANIFGKIAGADYTTLVAWQAAAGTDANSKNILPVYVSATDLHLVPATNIAFDNLGTPVSGITSDFDNDVRNATTPDIGADEFSPPACTAAVGGMTISSVPPPYCRYATTVLSLRGSSIGSGTTYQWQDSPDGASWTDIGGATSATYSVNFLAVSTWYRCVVGCTNSGTTDPSVPLQIVITALPTVSVTPPGPLYLCSPASQLLTGTTNAATPGYQWQLNGGNIGGATTNSYTVTTGGTYSLIVIDAATTCADTARVIVNIDPVPSAPVITPATPTICENGQAVALTITSGGAIPRTFEFGTQANQNSATTLAGGYPAPYSVYFGGQRQQMLVTAAELHAAGFTTGSQFTSLQFNVVSRGSNWGGSLTACQNFQVSIGHTSLTSIAAFQSGLTQVVAPANFTPVVGYSNTNTFGTAFTWNGTSNIIIETTFSNGVTMSGVANDVVIHYNSPTSFASTIVYRADNISAATAASATSINFTYNARPDFKLNGQAVGNFTWSPTAGLYTDASASTPYTGLAAMTVYAKPATATTYTATSCGASGSATVSITNPGALAGTPGGGQVCNTYDISSFGSTYYDGSCNLIAKAVPNSSPAVSGTVRACVTIDATVQNYLGEAYVQRHFDIEPSVNAANVRARITLYVLQSELDNYNANNVFSLDLPTGPADATGIAQLRVTQFHGTGTAPGNYTGGVDFINPADADIVWNASKNWWEISFNAIGFSGFYIHTGFSPLKVGITSLRGAITGPTNTIYWTTEQEENNRKFIVERSTDGSNFTAIGEVLSRAPNGTSTTPLDYIFVDANPVEVKAYYRLRMIDLSGRQQWSPVVSLRRGSNKLEIVDVRPNPATRMVYFNIAGGSNSNMLVVVRDLKGTEVMRKPLVQSANYSLDIGALASGLYMLEATDTRSGEKAVFKIVKQ